MGESFLFSYFFISMNLIAISVYTLDETKHTIDMYVVYRVWYTE